MIDINTAANIAEIAGGLAILASLIYVGYQIRQSNRIARASALQSILEGYSNRTLKYYLEHPDIMHVLALGHHRYAELSPDNMTLFNAWLNCEFIHMQNVKQFHGHSLVSDAEYQTWLGFTTAHIQTPGGKACWDKMKVSYGPDFVEVLEAYLRANPSAPSIIELYPEAYGEAAYLTAKEKYAS
jgi:hypothetical protein